MNDDQGTPSFRPRTHIAHVITIVLGRNRIRFVDFLPKVPTDCHVPAESRGFGIVLHLRLQASERQRNNSSTALDSSDLFETVDPAMLIQLVIVFWSRVLFLARFHVDEAAESDRVFPRCK